MAEDQKQTDADYEAYNQWKQDQLNPEKKAKEDFEKVLGGGFSYSPGLTNVLGAYNLGSTIGKRQFTDSPEFQRIRQGLEKYSQGYSSPELGRYRQTARGELAGSQEAAQRQMMSKASRGGVGGARAAAMSGQLGRQHTQQVADAERKMAMDSAQMERQGASNLYDFLSKTKLAEATMGGTFAQMSSAQTAADTASKANRGGKK